VAILRAGSRDQALTPLAGSTPKLFMGDSGSYVRTALIGYLIYDMQSYQADEITKAFMRATL
jgi:hypothetical protein